MFKPKEDWNEATPQEIPHATYWPITVALGIALLFFGILTVYYISIAGFIIFLVGLGGWISDLFVETNSNSEEHSSHGS